MAFFTIILPAFNRADLLGHAVESVKGQSYADFEVLIIDDGSTDPGVRTIGETAAAGDPRFKFFRMEVNSGISAARNLGIRNASGRYIAFLDSDDLYLPWHLEILHEVISVEKMPAFVAGTALAVYDRGFDVKAHRSGLETERFQDYLQYRLACQSKGRQWWFNPTCVALDREKVVEAGGLWSGRNHAGDADLWLRMGTSAGFVKINSPPMVAYRILPDSMISNYKEMYKGISRIFEAELGGQYPGGSSRERDRRSIIGTYVRHHALELVARGQPALGFDLYRRSFVWNLRDRRFLFLCGFPVFTLFPPLRKWMHRSARIAAKALPSE